MGIWLYFHRLYSQNKNLEFLSNVLPEGWHPMFPFEFRCRWKHSWLNLCSNPQIDIGTGLTRRTGGEEPAKAPFGGSVAILYYSISYYITIAYRSTVYYTVLCCIISYHTIPCYARLYYFSHCLFALDSAPPPLLGSETAVLRFPTVASPLPRYNYLEDLD